MRHIIQSRFAMLLLVLCGQSFAAVPLPLVQPAQSTLKLEMLQKREHIATFSGTVKVSGKLIAQWVPGVDQTDPNEKQYRIIVNEEASKKLPAFAGYPVQKIEVKNGSFALRKVTNKRAFENFMHKRNLVVEATGVFRLKSYVVGVECDAQWAKALVTEVIHPELLTSNHEPIGLGC